MITIGSDPEFGLTDERGNQVMAYNYLPDRTDKPIGTDGHRDIGELRPTYSETPRGHLANIQSLIEELSDMVPLEYNITAGSMVGPDAIGGHIHFGGLDRYFDKKLAIRALDYYLALPVALVEVQGSARRRRTDSGYGRLGAYRHQGWGLEYRTLPSWLASYGVALSILSIGYAIMDAVHRKSCPSIPADIPDPTEFNYCNKETLLKYMPGVRRGWRELPLHSEFRLETAFLNHLIVRGLEWREKEDIRDKWPSRMRERWVKGFKIKANPNDANCTRIIRLVEESKKNLRVFVYGLSPAREFNVAISHRATGAPDEPVALERFGRAASAEYSDWLCIGLGYDLRQDVERAADIVNRIIAGELTPPTRRYPRRDNQGNWRDSSGRYTYAPAQERTPF